MHLFHPFVPVRTILLLLVTLAGPSTLLAAYAEYELRVVDAETQLPCSAKIRITNSRDRAQRIDGALMIDGTAYFTGGLKMKLRPGQYGFRIDAGPEYPFMEGHFILNSGDSDSRTIEDFPVYR